MRKIMYYSMVLFLMVSCKTIEPVTPPSPPPPPKSTPKPIPPPEKSPEERIVQVCMDLVDQAITADQDLLNGNKSATELVEEYKLKIGDGLDFVGAIFMEMWKTDMQSNILTPNYTHSSIKLFVTGKSVFHDYPIVAVEQNINTAYISAKTQLVTEKKQKAMTEKATLDFFNKIIKEEILTTMESSIAAIADIKSQNAQMIIVENIPLKISGLDDAETLLEAMDKRSLDQLPQTRQEASVPESQPVTVRETQQWKLMELSKQFREHGGNLQAVEYAFNQNDDCLLAYSIHICIQEELITNATYTKIMNDAQERCPTIDWSRLKQEE